MQMTDLKGDQKAKPNGDDQTDIIDTEQNLTIDKNQMMGAQSKNRMNNWASNAIDDMQLLTKLRKGLVTQHSVHAYEFRDRNKSMEKSEVPFISKK